MSIEKKLDAIFKALGNARRRLILDLLKGEPKTTGEICNHLKRLGRCSVMQHLGVLEKAELIIARREGRHRWNYFNPLPIRELHDRWIDRYAVASVDLQAKMKSEMEG
jgi:DNA-binding transcriptional ArsR family regulator